MKGKDIILGILSKKGRTGYEINDILKNQLSYFYDGSYGMIYPTLRNLEKEELISKEVIIQDGKPNKNIYSITHKGKEAFEIYLHSELDDDIFKSDFLMRLFFGTSLSEDELKTLLEKEVKKKKMQIAKLKSNFEQWKETGELTMTQEMTIYYGLTQYEAIMTFLKDELKKLASK